VLGIENISIIIPMYNEEKAIGKVLEDLTGILHTDGGSGNEIIVVDDGSHDGSAQIVANREGVRLLQHPNNRGYGAALKTGIRHAKGDIIVIMDADGTYLSADVPKLVSYIGDHDMVVGARLGDDVEMPALRRFAKFLLLNLASYLARTKIPDMNSGLRAFKRDVAMGYIHLLPSTFSFTTTITLALLCNDYSVKFHPIDYRERIGKSKINPIRDTANFASLIVRTVMYFNPLRVFLPISASLMSLGVCWVGYTAFALHNVTDSGILIILTSIVIGAIGLLADLIVKRNP
jgi:glycosyltransferase involved in cell wall biosynthesis